MQVIERRIFINKRNCSYFVLNVFVVLSSTGFYYVSIPAVLLIYAYLVFSGRFLKVNYRLLILIFLLMFSVGLSLFIGAFDSEFGESIGYSFYLFSLFTCMVFLVGTEKSKNPSAYIYSFLLGSFLYYTLIVVYSCVIYSGSLSCGYGSLYNFVKGSVDNTPGYANTLSMLPVLCLSFIVFNPLKGNIVKVFISFFVVFVAFVLLSYLSSRASYVLLFSGLLVSLFISEKRRFLFLTLQLAAVLLIGYFTIYYLISIEYINFDVLYNRIQSRGLETQRIERYSSGFTELFSTPIGTYRMEHTAGKNNLIHNIYLDLAKFGGWIVFLSFLLFSALGMSRVPFGKNNEYKGIFTLYVVSWLSLQQDVFYGSGLPVLVVFLMSVTYLYTRKETERTKTSRRLSV